MLAYSSQPQDLIFDPGEIILQSGEVYIYKASSLRSWLELQLQSSSISVLPPPEVRVQVYIDSQINIEALELDNFPLTHFHFHTIENCFQQFLNRLKQAKAYLESQVKLGVQVHAEADVHPSAVVEGRVDQGAKIGPFCWVAPGAHIQARAQLESHVSVYPAVQVGPGAIIQAGVVLGSRGFGFGEQGELIPHLAGVNIGRDSHIGAQSVVAAGCLRPTSIGDSTHLDSFVQIGHHAQVGNQVKMASQSGVGGSTQVGDHTLIAAGAQIKDNIKIGDRAVIAARAGVIQDVPDGMQVGGFPAVELKVWQRMHLWLKSQVER